ncbi:uncharacterized protein TA04830 [Theileria annulata]|uniref:Uncharacterized protein n=1 Tax=Theileria annulata TaxID=5874 RepID=Q4UBU3_THEAN|nr:uncharacterized protein TA04830 [Theileria annulata]CAI75708.1 hypothetical protein, conserved [Theileria annulata]|eukprot:XP_955184.1 hypothetical protein, conserved [Theileria annulata]
MYDMFYLLPIFLIFLISYSNLLNKFYSRKLVHLGCGIILAKINEPKIPLKYIIELIAILSIISCFILPFPFSRKYDLGVITYNLSILFFIWFNLPLRILLPMFIIDPMASIIGINFNSPIWIHTKTLNLGYFRLIYVILVCFRNYNCYYTHPKKGETITIPNTNVNIKTGTPNPDGTCNTTATSQITGTVTIKNPTKTEGPKLTITNITDTANALQNTDAGTECNVSVDAEKGTLKIKYKEGNTDKCIEITLTGNSIKTEAAAVPYGHIFTEPFDTILSH